MLALAVTLCLLSLPASVRAAGCHVPERPVFSRSLAWDHSQLTPSANVSNDLAAPPAIRPLPCQGETPTAPTPAIVVSAAAVLVSTRPIAPRAGEPLAIRSDASAPNPDGPRLDRPPRRIPAIR